jgi:phosphatidylinositol alpha 1,6-mannosyltransferase
VTESFLPVINGVSNSVRHVVEHLTGCGHQVLVIAPGTGPDNYHGAAVVRVPAADLPVVDSVPVGLPSPSVMTAMRDFRPDIVHLASPVIVGFVGRLAPESSLWCRGRGTPTTRCPAGSGGSHCLV